MRARVCRLGDFCLQKKKKMKRLPAATRENEAFSEEPIIRNIIVRCLQLGDFLLAGNKRENEAFSEENEPFSVGNYEGHSYSLCAVC